MRPADDGRGESSRGSAELDLAFLEPRRRAVLKRACRRREVEVAPTDGDSAAEAGVEGEPHTRARCNRRADRAFRGLRDRGRPKSDSFVGRYERRVR